MLREVIAKAY